MKSFLTWLRLGPHFVVGSPDYPYMLRWWIFPRNRWGNVYIHKFLRDDDDRALHDHPWPSLSIIIWGRYVEQTEKGRRNFGFLSFIWRSATYRHRIELIDGKPCWTLFFHGPRSREWGFWCPQGFVPWFQFVAADNQGDVGKGCDQ